MRVIDLFNKDMFPDFRLLAGSSGLDREISSVGVIDVPDGYKWVRGGELLLTSGFIFSHDLNSLVEFVARAAEGRAAALSIKLGRFFRDLPPRVLEMAEEMGFPILNVPLPYRWSDVIELIQRRLAKEERLLEEEREPWVEMLTRGDFLDAKRLLSSLSSEIQREIWALIPVLGLTHSFQPDGSILPLEEDSLRRARSHPSREALDLRGPITSELIEVEGGRVVARYVLSQQGLAELRLVLLPGESSPSRYQEQVMRRASQLLRMAVLESAYSSSREEERKERFLENLCLGFYADQSLVEEEARSLGIEVPSPSFVVLFAPQEAETALGFAPPYELSYRLGSSWVAILPAELRRGGELERMSELAQRRRMWVLLGSVSSNALEIQRSYQEVKRALELVSRFKAPAGVYSTSELALYSLLSAIPRLPESHALWERYWKPLVEMSKRRHALRVSQLVAALIKHDFNAKAAAEELHVHYNTVRNHLEDMALNLGLDLKLPEHKLALTLAYYVDQVTSRGVPPWRSG